MKKWSIQKSMIYLNVTETEVTEEGDYFEGDMILTQEQIDLLYNNGGRNGLRDSKFRWPLHEVPYDFDFYKFTQLEISIIMDSMKFLQMVSCVKFVEVTYQTDFLWISV